MVTKTEYWKALEVYVRYAYPDNKEAQKSKLAWLKNPSFLADGIPAEARFGCHVNPHMKLRVTKDAFWVDTNDMEDPEDVRNKCREIKESIEADWKTWGLPVYSG